jgi:DNA polymerase alpha-associated DNA helicase A
MPPQEKSPISIQDFCTTQLSLLDAELQSELYETTALISSTSLTALQRAGLAITNLTLNSQRTGLGGKTVLELCPDSATANAEGDLPEHGIRTGDIVVVSEVRQTLPLFPRLFGSRALLESVTESPY